MWHDTFLPTMEFKSFIHSLLQVSGSDLSASKGRKRYLDFIDTLLEAKVLLGEEGEGRGREGGCMKCMYFLQHCL